MGRSDEEHDPHPHSEDRHVHGEPWRVLEEEPYPSTAVLYGEDAHVGEEDRDYWHASLVENGLVERLFGGGEHVERPGRGLNFPRSDFSGFDPRLDDEGLLLIPAGLRIEASAWRDLASNDVTVSWLAVDPEGDSTGGRQVAVLSDWVVKMGPSVSPARSAGTAPGILHVTRQHREAFERAAREGEGLVGVVNRFVKRDGIKLRPGFLHGAAWSTSDG